MYIKFLLFVEGFYFIYENYLCFSVWYLVEIILGWKTVVI